MTVTTSTNKIIHTANGVAVDFTYNFIVLEEAHMEVYLDGVLESTSNWSIVGLGDQAGGTVTMTSAPANGVKVTLRRVVPNTQLIDYSAYGSFPSETHERALDLRVMEAQQLEEENDRAIKAPIDDAGAFDYSLPSPVAGKAYKINATADGLELTTNDPDEQEALAEIQANNAAASASAASTSASQSSGYADAAQLRAWEAEAEKMTADSYATEAEDTFVNVWTSDGDGTFTATPTTEYSALHWKAKAQAEAASVITDYDSCNAVMLPTDWQTVNKQGWDHFGFNQQWGGAPWGGRLVDGTDGEVATCHIKAPVTALLGNSSANTYRAQSFKVPTATSCSSISIFASKVGNPTTDLEVFIYDDNAGKPGSLITNGTATPQSGKLHSSDFNEILFIFHTPPSLSADTTYHIVLKSTVNASHYWALYGNNAHVYPYGYLNTGDATPTWTSTVTFALTFKVNPTAATSTIQNGEFNAADTTQLGQAPALIQKLEDVLKWDKDGKFTFQFKVGDVPTASKPLCQAYYDNDTHITVETDASSHAIVRCNGSTITGTSVLAADDSIGVYYNGTNLALTVKGIGEGTPVAVSFPDNFGEGSFIIGGAIPTDLTWTKETDMSLLPSADGWTFAGSATEANVFSVSDGELYQNYAGYGATQNGYYTLTTALSNATGWRVDTEIQVKKSANSVLGVGSAVFVRDGSKDIRVSFNEYFMELIGDAAGANNVGYVQHDFTKKTRVTVLGKGSDFYVFLDGKLAFDGTGLLLYATASNNIQFGDLDGASGNNADAVWGYVSYSSTFESPTFTTTPLYDFGFWQKDASSILDDVAAADVKSITGLKEDWVDEAYRESVAQGIVSSPTTTSTTATGIPDLNAFIVGHGTVYSTADISFDNSVAGAATEFTVANDGISKESGSARVAQHSAGYLIHSTVTNSSEINGLSYGEMMWHVTSGTATGRTTKRKFLLEAR